MQVTTKNISWGVENQQIVKSITLDAYSGEIVGLVGPNGSGKSSLLRLVYRFYLPQTGVIFLGNRSISSLSTRDIAIREAVVSQERSTNFDFSVYEVVMMGRTPPIKVF